jgi:hypothetical protein
VDLTRAGYLPCFIRTLVLFFVVDFEDCGFVFEKKKKKKKKKKIK